MSLTRKQQYYMTIPPLVFVIGSIIYQIIFHNLLDTQYKINIFTILGLAGMLSVAIVFLDQLGKTFEELQNEEAAD